MPNIDRDTYNRLKEISDMHPLNIQGKLKEFLKEVKPRSQRTNQQNKSLWKDCEIIADKLEKAGIDWKHIIREGGIDIPVTKDSVMDFMWRPTMKTMFGITSTTELSKSEGQIDQTHEVIMRTLGEKHGIEWHDFPHREKERAEVFEAMEGSEVDYPAYKGEPKL